MKKGKFIYNNQELQWTSDGRVRVIDDRDPELQEYIDCFKKYVEKLNDNVFIAAVEMFPSVANITMHSNIRIMSLKRIVKNEEIYSRQ